MQEQHYPCHVKLEMSQWTDADLAVNAHAVLSAVEKKLPSGEKNLKRVIDKNYHGQTS